MLVHVSLPSAFFHLLAAILNSSEPFHKVILKSLWTNVRMRRPFARLSRRVKNLFHTSVLLLLVATSCTRVNR